MSKKEVQAKASVESARPVPCFEKQCRKPHRSGGLLGVEVIGPVPRVRLVWVASETRVRCAFVQTVAHKRRTDEDDRLFVRNRCADLELAYSARHGIKSA